MYSGGRLTLGGDGVAGTRSAGSTALASFGEHLALIYNSPRTSSVGQDQTQTAHKKLVISDDLAATALKVRPLAGSTTYRRLDRLEVIVGNLYVSHNAHLKSLHLPRLRLVVGDVIFRHNPKLELVEWLDEVVVQGCIMYSNTAWTNVSEYPNNKRFRERFDCDPTGAKCTFREDAPIIRCLSDHGDFDSRPYVT